MSINRTEIEFIYQELDIAKKYAGEGTYSGGIKARTLDSMDCVSRFFASCFGHTMEYKGKVYLVGEESFRRFSIRHDCASSAKFDPIEATKNIMEQYTELAFKKMKGAAEAPPMIKIKDETLSVQKKDLEKIFNALGVPAEERDRVTLQFTETKKKIHHYQKNISQHVKRNRI